MLLHYATIYTPYTAISIYPSSFIGDLFNGMVAQAFNRTSTFGGLLDMVTDRCTTLGLIFILYREYGDTDKEYQFGYAFRIIRKYSIFVFLFEFGMMGIFGYYSYCAVFLLAMFLVSVPVSRISSITTPNPAHTNSNSNSSILY